MGNCNIVPVVKLYVGKSLDILATKRLHGSSG